MADGPTSLRFAAAVRRLGPEVRRLGLVMPGFRSPPRVAGATRSVRHRGKDRDVVAIRLAGREFDDVLVDMVEGVVVSNGLVGDRAAEVRAVLLEAVRGE